MPRNKLTDPRVVKDTERHTSGGKRRTLWLSCGHFVEQPASRYVPRRKPCPNGCRAFIGI